LISGFGFLIYLFALSVDLLRNSASINLYSRTGSSFLGLGLAKAPGDFEVFLRNE
tara:strand:+ start:184 stop:348 length:165 start_codon:yes stop_codon:yes gene_type:complete